MTADIAANWQKIDDTPGYKPCTSSTRPSTWGAAHAGMLIVETDTGLVWRWDGSAFKRVGPAGVLKTTGGGLAIATRTTDFSTTSFPFVICLSLTNVVVPDGSRPIALIVTGQKAENSSGSSVGAIFPGATANTGTILATFDLVGDSTSPTAGAQGAGFCHVAWEPSGKSPGTYSWSFQVRCSPSWGGTAYVRALADRPNRLVAVEL